MKQKTSIFRQIFFTVSIPEMIIFLIVSLISYMQLTDIFEKDRNEKLEVLKKESEMMLDLRDSALKSSGKYLNLLSETSIDHFIAYCQEQKLDPSKADLDAYIEEFLEPGVMDLYVIDTSGEIVNTSFDKDLGVNFFAFGSKYDSLGRALLKHGKVFVDEFSLETKTKELKKYAYKAMPNRKYIIEFGVYSEETKLLKNSVVRGLDEIVDSLKNIKALDIITPGSPPHSLYHPELKIDKNEEAIINSLFKYKDTSYSHIDKNFIYHYQVVARPPGSIYKQLMVRIVYDRAQDKSLLRKELYYEIALFFAGITLLFIILYLNVKRLVRPILRLSAKAKLIGEGKLSERVKVTGSNEITDLTIRFNNMVDNLESSRNQLMQQNEEIIAQSEQIEEQKKVLEHKNEQITASINYAKRIQEALLRVDSRYKFPDHFIFFRPKDIVGGDFYWMLEKDEYLYMAAADCTGHGVPGGFLTMLGSSFLNEINSTTEIMSPAAILDLLRDKVVKELSQTGKFGESNDGMDISLIRLHKSTRKLEWAGANNPVYIVKDGVLSVIKGDREPIGYISKPTPFTNHSIDLDGGEHIYLFSDGYADQFGGPENKKFGYRNLKKLLLEISELPIAEQKEVLKTKFDSWIRQGEDKQIDDVCVIGLKIE